MILSVGCVTLYGYALAGYAGYSFGRGRPDYIAWGLSLGTLCGAAALHLWKKWMKASTPDIIIFDVDGVLIDARDSHMRDMEEKSGISRDWKILGLPVGIYTERSREEMALVWKVLNWSDFPEDMLVSSSDGISKPSPLGLSLLCDRAGAQVPLFFGDDASDREAWAAFGKGIFVAIGPILKAEARRAGIHHYDTLESALSELIG